LNERETHFLTHALVRCSFPKELRGVHEGVRDEIVGVANTLLFDHPLRDRRKLWERKREPRKPFSEEEIHTGLKVAREMLRTVLIHSKFEVSGEDWERFCVAMKQVDLDGPLPPVDPSFRENLDTVEEWGDAPSGKDLVQVTGDLNFLWDNRLVRGKLNLIASNPKVGKTTLGIELQRRHWFGLPQHGQTHLVYPAETPSLWICGDFNEDEVIARGKSFGIPGDAFRFMVPNERLKVVNLEDPNTVKHLEHYLAKRDYGFVCIDTAWGLTSKKLYSTDDVKSLWQPYAELARKANVAFLITTHTSKDDDALGRRIEGIVRSVTKLYSKGDSQRRLTTEIYGCRKPADLLMVIQDNQVEFREYSPEKQGLSRKNASSPKQSAPPSKQDVAAKFILTARQAGPRLSKEIRKDWEAQGGNRFSIHHAKYKLEKDGELRVITDSTGQELWELIDPLAELFQGSDVQDS
jgi:hypothetical protein